MDLFASNMFAEIQHESYEKMWYATTSIPFTEMYGAVALEVTADNIKKVSFDNDNSFLDWAKELEYSDIQEMINGYYGGDVFDALNLDNYFDEQAKLSLEEGFNGVEIDFGTIKNNTDHIFKLGTVLIAKNMNVLN